MPGRVVWVCCIQDVPDVNCSQGLFGTRRLSVLGKCFTVESKLWLSITLPLISHSMLAFMKPHFLLSVCDRWSVWCWGIWQMGQISYFYDKDFVLTFINSQYIAEDIMLWLLTWFKLHNRISSAAGVLIALVNILTVTTAVLGFLLQHGGRWINYENVMLLSIFLRMASKKN